MGLLDQLKARKISAPAEKKPDFTVPEAVLLSELWRDPNESSGLAAIIPWINTGILAVILIRVFIH